jgi:hypothetical protein
MALLRRAKRKLPNEVKKKVEEWKFSSGALVMCLVAYSDGQDVQSFQLVLHQTQCHLSHLIPQRRELPYGRKYIYQCLQGLEGWDI